MARTPLRSWIIGPNIQFSDQTDQVIQYQEILFALKTILVAAGWPVQLSSDTVTAGSGDRWLSAANVVLGLAGAGSWITFRSPLAWDSHQVDLLLHVDATGLNPRRALIQIAIDDTQPYTGGSTVSLPTTTGPETTILSGGTDLLPWTTATNGRYATWYTSRGDIMIGAKVTGRPFFSQFHYLTSNTNADGGGVGNRRWILAGRTAVGSDVFLSWSSFARKISNPTGALANGNTEIQSPLSALVSTDDGVNNRGKAKWSPFNLWATTAADGRNMGLLFNGDVADTIRSNIHLPFGVLDDTERDQPLRRICLTEIAVYWPKDTAVE